MNKFLINMDSVPAELKTGLEELQSAKVMDLDFTGDAGTKLTFEAGAPGVKVTGRGDGVVIGYNAVNDAFRGLGLANAADDLTTIDISEKRSVDKTWIMLDASRNRVYTVAAIREWLQFMALAGVNGFMLYTEETYEIPGEPLFGYMRGRYTHDELKEIDDIAHSLGIEAIPCFQTLAHLQRMLRYDAYTPVKDTSSVMLCDEPESYELIEKMIDAITVPFRSKRVHLGMDEAWDLGRGALLDQTGVYQAPFDVISRHLEKVLQITRARGLEPMIWGDMFFRALAGTHNYYDTSIEITPELKAKVPQDVQLIYWDYYHTKRDVYDAMIEKTRQLSDMPVVVAPGIWTWNHFWAAYDFSEKTLLPCMESCADNNVQDLILTMWGDDGAECDFFSALPMVQYVSDIIFGNAPSYELSGKNLLGTMGANMQAWQRAGMLDKYEKFGGEYQPNMSKALLWEHPALGLYQPELRGEKLGPHFAALRDDLAEVYKTPGNERLEMPYLLAHLLEIKADFPTILQEAYLADDRAALTEMAEHTIEDIIARITQLRHCQRDDWFKNCKPFGWEVMENRYGAQILAMDTLIVRLRQYLTGQVDALPELAEPRVRMFTGAMDETKGIGSAFQPWTTSYVSHMQM
jgi:hexosaminidase